MNRRLVAAIVVCVWAVAGAISAAGARLDRGGDTLPDWVAIHGRTYAGKSADELAESLETVAAGRLAERVILIVTLPEGRRRMWQPTLKMLGERVDISATVKAAFDAARSEGVWGRLTRRFVHRDPVAVGLVVRLDDAALTRYLKYIVSPTITRPGKPARMVLVSGKPSIIQDRPGLALDIDASAAAVRELLAGRKGDRVDLVTRVAPASVTVAEASGIIAEIARFETHYRERGNRRENLELACAKINGTIIKPGGVFSYNETVGPRVAEAGFKMAPVIVRGRMEPGIGGGICQVSSTLYNAALLAGLGVVTRSHHAFPVHYLPAGRDATVAYGAIDLKLRNTTDTAVGVVADGSNGRVVVRLFGTPVPGRTISIERTGIGSWPAPVKTVSDPSLPIGKTVTLDRGHSGHRVTVWRVIKQDGRVVQRELLSRDVYRAFPKVVARGTALPAAPSGSPPVAGPTTSPGTLNGGSRETLTP